MIKILILYVLVLISFNANAGNLYVSNTGSDFNNGTTLAQAFQTIQKAHDVSIPGDIINVADGIYSSGVTITRSGSSNNWITYKSINKHGAKIIDNWNSCINIGNVNLDKVDNVSYIAIDGFNLQATYDYAAGIISDWGAHHIKVKNCWIHDCGASGISLGHGDYLEIRDNICNHNSTLFGELSGSGISIYGKKRFDSNPGFHIVISGNICYNNVNGPLSPQSDGNGIIIDDLRCTQFYHTIFETPTDINYTDFKVLVENNLCYGNEGAGIQTFLSNNVTIRNNTVYNNQLRRVAATWRGELTASCCKNVVFANNIAVSNSSLRADGGLADWSFFSYNTAIGAYALEGNEYGSNYLFFNNITFDLNNNSSNSISTEGISISIVNLNDNKCATNPKFISANLFGNSNFRLKPGSEAINAGSNISGISNTDLDGNPRVYNGIVDIGCYEYYPSLPIVSIVANKSSALESIPSNRFFKLKRTGIKNNELVVYYSLSGSATNSIDYQYLTGTVTIPVGNIFATINLTTIADTIPEGTELVLATIVMNDTYTIDSLYFSATIKIIDDIKEKGLKEESGVSYREKFNFDIDNEMEKADTIQNTRLNVKYSESLPKIAQELKIDNISIFPNPSSDEAFLNYKLTKNGRVLIWIVDVAHKQVVKVLEEKQGAGENGLIINTKHLASGTYFLVVEVNDLKAIKKLIVIH